MSHVKLLIVDDELFIRELLQEYFSQFAIAVDIAPGAEAAIRMGQVNCYDVALVDLKLRDQSGIEVLQGLRALDPDLPTIVMTGYPTVDSAIKALRVGAYDYIVKPFRLHELKSLVTRAIEEHRSRVEVSLMRNRILEKRRNLPKFTQPDYENQLSGRPRSTTVKRQAVACAEAPSEEKSFIFSSEDEFAEGSTERRFRLPTDADMEHQRLQKST